MVTLLRAIYISFICIAYISICNAREIIYPSQIENGHTLTEPNGNREKLIVRAKQCDVFILDTKVSINASKKAYNGLLFNDLKSYKDNRIYKIFHFQTGLLAGFLSNYNISTKKGVCYLVLYNDYSPPVAFYISSKNLEKIKNRDFGSNDLSYISKGKNLLSGNYRLPMPLINIFKNIKVGKIQREKNKYIFVNNSEYLDKYRFFLKSYSIPYYFLQFDETLAEDAWQLRSEKLIYSKEKYKLAQNKMKIAKSKNNYCSIFATDEPTYHACKNNLSVLKGKYGHLGQISSYISENKCNFVAMNDTSGIAAVCELGKNGCSSLKYSQEVINACYSCNGSNRWLRMFASSLINGKILPKCY